MRPATLDARFRFPDEHRFTPDRIATEYRMLIRGYLDQMNYLFATDPRAQEIRDCATRIYELTAALSAHEMHKHFHPPQVANPLADLTDLRESHAKQSKAQIEDVSRETVKSTIADRAEKFAESVKEFGLVTKITVDATGRDGPVCDRLKELLPNVEIAALPLGLTENVSRETRGDMTMTNGAGEPAQ